MINYLSIFIKYLGSVLYACRPQTLKGWGVLIAVFAAVGALTFGFASPNAHTLPEACQTMIETGAADDATAQRCKTISETIRNQQQGEFFGVLPSRFVLLFLISLIGFGFAALSRYLSWQNLKHQQASHQENHEQTLEANRNERFGQAVEMLGAEKELLDYNGGEKGVLNRVSNIEVRLGAIYALETLIREWDEAGRNKAIKVLNAYIRSYQGPIDGNQELSTSPPPPPPEEIRAILEVLATSTEPGEFNDYHNSGIRFLDLRGLNLSRIWYFDTDFSNSLLSFVDFSHSELRESNFSGLDLTQTSFYNANLQRCNLQGVEAAGVKWEDTNLEGAILDGANFFYRNDHKNLSSVVYPSVHPLSKANLEKASLVGVDLSKTGLPNAFMRSSVLNDSYFKETNFREANLIEVEALRADFTKAKMHKVHLGRANLTGADMSGALLTKANLEKSILRNSTLCDANLRGALLNGADLKDANLTGANLIGADLRGANVMRVQLLDAITDDSTLTNFDLN